MNDGECSTSRDVFENCKPHRARQTAAAYHSKQAYARDGRLLCSLNLLIQAGRHNNLKKGRPDDLIQTGDGKAW
jgi:hypothetical protein